MQSFDVAVSTINDHPDLVHQNLYNEEECIVASSRTYLYIAAVFLTIGYTSNGFAQQSLAWVDHRDASNTFRADQPILVAYISLSSFYVDDWTE